MEYNQIIHGDSYDILPTLPDNSFDAVIIDPPYGMGIDTWDKPVDAAFFTEQIARIGREFYAVFGQMPYMREWDRQAEKQGLYFLEHISWVKRNNIPSKRLMKTHEEIYIYAVGQKRDFYKTTGKYEDVKIPGLAFDLISIDGIARYISCLHQWIETGKQPYGTNHIEKRKTTAYTRLMNSVDMRGKRFRNYTNAWSFLPDNLKYISSDKIHPTMKPVLLLIRLIELLTPKNGSILDCFSGSGTTAIACQRLNRQFLCIEKEQEFYELSVERLNNDVWQPELEFTK